MTSSGVRRRRLASASHPWRTIGAWVAAMVVAFVAIGGLLGGARTTEGNPTKNPPSERANAVREAAFPASSSAAMTDIVVVRSPRYTVDAPTFRTLVRRLAGEVREAEDVESIRTYLGARDPSLV